MAIGLLGWSRNLVTVGKVVSRTAIPPNLYQFLLNNADDIAAHFDFLQLPPSTKAQGGDGDGCDGYEVFDPFDLGTKNQQGSVQTRWGTLEQLMNTVAALNARGVKTIGDYTIHQRGGENGGPGVFKCLGADGKTLNGAGNALPGWFRGGMGNSDPIPPFRPEDPVPAPADDFPFGREIVFQNALPAGATMAFAKQLVHWLTTRTGMPWLRCDDTKGTMSSAIAEIMNSVPAIVFYSEYFDGNPDNLNWWATTWPMNSRSAVEDFTLHWRIQAACDGYDATQLTAGGYGYCEWNSDLSIVFVDNPDTDTSYGQQVAFNKGLAYAWMLSLPCRLALVYGKDYYSSAVWPGGYGLKPIIDNLCWISRTFAFGAMAIRWIDKDVFCYTRDGNGGALGWSGGLLIAGNFNTYNDRTITVQTMWAPGQWVHDYSGQGHAPDLTVGTGGMLTIPLKANANSAGVSFVGYSKGGYNQPYPMNSDRTTQVFYGDSTLDVMPLAYTPTPQYMPQRLSCAAKSTFDATFTFDRTHVDPTASVELQVYDPTGLLVTKADTGTGASVHLHTALKGEGFYSLALDFTYPVPEAAPAPVSPTFTLSVTYLGA